MASRRATLVISIFASLPAATGASNGYLDVFHAWKEQHSKQYATVAEETFRRAIFSKEPIPLNTHTDRGPELRPKSAMGRAISSRIPCVTSP